jgi:hypothetical protein
MKKKSNKEKGSDFEDKIFKTINSGALSFQKGDIQTKDYVIDAKYTDKKGFRISTVILNKLWKEALESNKLPLLIIGIKDENSSWTITCNITKEMI